MGRMDYFNNRVFINCPFDAEYHPILNAIVLAIFDCGFIPRYALEEEDASQIRIEKIYSIITSWGHGVAGSNSASPNHITPFFSGVRVFYMLKKIE